MSVVRGMAIAWERVQNRINPLRRQATTDANIAQWRAAERNANAAGQARSEEMQRQVLGVLAPGANLIAGSELATQDATRTTPEQAALQGELAELQRQAEVARSIAEMERWMRDYGAAPDAPPGLDGGSKASSAGTFSSAAIGFMAGGADPVVTQLRNNDLTQRAVLERLLAMQGLVMV